MRDLKLALSLIAKDNGSKALRQALTGIQQQTTANKKAEDEAARSREQSAQSGIRAARSLQQEYQRSASARSTLGIRSEREIQREIAQTQAAYNRLLRTGSLTVNEQTRAFRAMTQQVAQLRTELNGAGQSMSRMERMRNWGGNVSAIAGGIVTAGAIVAPSVRNQMSYDERLADMANTAFDGRNVSGRIGGIKELDQLVRKAVSVGGGNKETAAEALNELLASGSVSFESASSFLPVLQKYATASGSSSVQLAQMAVALKRNFGITDAQIPTALNMAIKSGQMGSFEMKDMAKWFPQQLATGGSIGMKGLTDFASLLGLNQASAITAGTKDEAGNNVVNLLAKITSADAANAAARIKFNGKGIDLPGTLARARGKGMNSLEAFDGLVDKIVHNDSKYKSLEKKLKTVSNEPERREIMESQAKILESSAVGQIIADRQALMALIAYRANRQYVGEVSAGANEQRNLPEGQAAGDINFEVMSSRPGYKVNQLNNTRDFAQMDAVQPLSDILAKVSGELTEYAGAYPGLTKAMASAEIAIKAMTAAAWVFAGMKFLSGNNPVVPSQTPVPPGATPPVSGGMWGGLSKLFGAGMSATAIATFTTRDEDEEITNGPAKWAAIRAKYSQDRIDRARKLYQPWYQFGQGYATENETWLAQLEKDEAAGTVPVERNNQSSPIIIPQTANGYTLPGWLRQPNQALSANLYTEAPDVRDSLPENVSEQRGWSDPLFPYSEDRFNKVRQRYLPRLPEYQDQTDDTFWFTSPGKDDAGEPIRKERDYWWTPPTAFNIPQAAEGYSIPSLTQTTPSAQPVVPQINATIKLEVDGRTLAETVNEINGQSATRGPQGGPF
ncbi:phage tail tape measure protein [Phytobacter diazotrophicus]|uniref:phage tail tape measure protein n=1 Tax=Phytobacter diazotrophicus TaxID=395631 RepID=UPI002FF5AD17